MLVKNLIIHDYIEEKKEVPENFQTLFVSPRSLRLDEPHKLSSFGLFLEKLFFQSRDHLSNYSL